MVKNVALVLGGGGSAGHAWTIGVIAGLAEAGIDMTEAADLVIGTSSGATAAAQVRSGIPPAEDLCVSACERPAAEQWNHFSSLHDHHRLMEFSLNPEFLQNGMLPWPVTD
jgi:predicted acylesterase/phospholipase RssA